MNAISGSSRSSRGALLIPPLMQIISMLVRLMTCFHPRHKLVLGNLYGFR